MSIFYYPLNTLFVWFQERYRDWKRNDKVSFYIATPLYYLLFIITAGLSIPFEKLGEGMHPPLDKFK
jgi:hypothetical protein